MFASAIIAAAGRGERMNADVNKLYLALHGRPVLAWTVEVFIASGLFEQIILAVAAGEEEHCRKTILDRYFAGATITLVRGGRERQYSVGHALNALEPRCQLVCVHDGARPLVTPDILEACLALARREGAAISAVPVKDTVKEGEAGRVLATLERSRLFFVHTPQCFQRDILERAHRVAAVKGVIGTDDAALVEQLGEPVFFSPGSYENLKITTPEDLVLAEEILRRRDRQQ